MKNLFTCVTLSAKALARELPVGVSYVNHVSVFTEAAELHQQRMLSIQKVDTPYFFFCDDTDDLPNLLPEPKKGIIYGHNHYKQTSQKGVTENGPWSAERHLTRPEFIHKAICNTELAKKICLVLPQGEYYTEALLYYALALVGGAEFSEDLVLNWNKQSKGMHNKMFRAKIKSILWLINNEVMLLNIFGNHQLQTNTD